MAPPNATSLARQARRTYLDLLVRELPATATAIVEGARLLAQAAADPAIHARRRDAALDLPPRAPVWQQQWHDRLVAADLATLSPGAKAPAAPRREFSLVDDDTIEHDILASRLALAISDRATWQFTDLRARLSTLERFEDLSSQDLLQPQTLANSVLDAWLAAGLPLDHWRTLQTVIHDEASALAEAGYHEANRWLLGQGVRPEIDLRPFIRRSRASAPSGLGRSSGSGGLGGASGATGTGGMGNSGPSTLAGSPSIGRVGADGGNRGDSTRAQGDAASASPTQHHAEVVLSRLNEMMSRHLTDYAGLPGRRPQPASARLGEAIRQTQAQIQQRFRAPAPGAPEAATPPLVLEDLQRSKQALKQAADTPVERATIEVVALMFQSILTDERIPASVRVWFARLQMPVLRVAVGEPDFFANVDHPARQLIDRMGSCVMGFYIDTGTVGDALELEIKRIVQVVEAYPDTGRRVFQTVLTEFERFLKHYFTEHETTRKGVSLAQQVEQRETLAIQYTIELRKMLNDVPVQEGVRDFLFHVWADVLATTAVKHGPNADETRAMKRAAADLIWSASAKVSREERAEVIRRLPPLLKTLREGMAGSGIPPLKQEEHIQRLNNSLAAAFTAKAASISDDRLAQLMARLETLDELLPEVGDIEVDQSTIMNLSDYETENLEVVSGGGTAPTPGMVKWAQQLQVGSWYQLDYRNRVEPVQLVWQGVRKHLMLFSTPNGRGILFQSHRLAAFLQAGLLVPAEDESLTTRATRKALAKLDADPERLLS
ncbi:MAG: DUF1631 family protein [Burkholderiales bacterium]|nr:DUF1631 family protein [Burkholderiales bacterium]